tara:strand:+ start:263 stop:592 length:330 start_codon:yes stop_codon:yes gene_type:complete
MQSITLQQVKEKLTTLDDKTLSNMLKHLTLEPSRKDNLFSIELAKSVETEVDFRHLKVREENKKLLKSHREAIKNEMASRCAKEYILREADNLGFDKKHLDNKLQIIIG